MDDTKKIMALKKRRISPYFFFVASFIEYRCDDEKKTLELGQHLDIIV